MVESAVASLNLQGRYSESLFLLEQLVEESLSLLGLMQCNELNVPHKAIEYLVAAEKFCPGSWIIPTNLCHAYNLCERYDEALAAAQRAIKVGRGVESDTWYNAGVVLGNMGRFEESAEYYKQAIALNPSPAIRHNLSNMLLVLGDFKNGWPEYEFRLSAFTQTNAFVQRFKQPMWDGVKTLHGKTILVFNEQGVGDLINFGRYIRDLKKKGAIVWLECQEKVMKLFEASDLGISKVIPRPDDNFPVPPLTDYAVSVCSLPYLLKVHKVASIKPYLKIANSVAKIEPTEKFKVGICWAGNATHPHDSYRTCPVGFLAPLQNIENIQLYSLQKDANQIRKWKGQFVNINAGIEGLNLIDLSSQINDFNDTANLIKQLDLVVTVDTAIAHIAGAMGRPVIMMIATLPDWRWLKYGLTTPWYPSMRIVRQEKYREWPAVIAKVIQEVEQVRNLRGQPDSDQPSKEGSKKQRRRKH